MLASQDRDGILDAEPFTSLEAKWGFKPRFKKEKPKHSIQVPTRYLPPLRTRPFPFVARSPPARTCCSLQHS